MILTLVLAAVVMIQLYIILVLRTELSATRDRLLSEMKEKTLMESKYQRARMPIEMTEIRDE